MFSSERLQKIKKSVPRSSSVNCTSSSVKSMWMTRKVQGLVQWLEDFINKTGDYMPHKSEIHLCVGSLANLYKMYTRHCATYESEVSSYETLRRKFKAISHFVKIPKTKLFTRCDECDDWDEKIKAATTTLDKKVLEKKKADHLEWQFRERKVYYRHRYLAQTQPHEYACIMIDGMDQKKTNVPRYHSRLPKSCDGLEQLNVTIIGALLHGHTSLMHYMPNDFKKDANVTIQVLINALKSLKRQRRGKPWPHTLFLQLDGAGDNKNKHVLALLAHLVKANLFETVWSIDGV